MIAILSDIHGNMPALLAVLNDMPTISQIWVAGDSLGEFPYPTEVLDKLIELKVRAVAGNREISLLEYYNGEHPEWKNGRQFGVLAHTAEKLTSDHWEYLKSLPHPLIMNEEGGGLKGGAILAHGAPINIRKLIKSSVDATELIHSCSQNLIVVGHTHHIKLFKENDKIVIGAGSVGLPLDGVGGIATYVLYDEITKKIVFRQVSYDIEVVIRDMKERGYSETSPGVCEAIIYEMQTGRHYMMSLAHFATTYASKKMGKPIDVVPNELWKEAEILWDRTEWK